MIWNIIIGVVVLRRGQQQMNKLSEENCIYISVVGVQNSFIVFI